MHRLNQPSAETLQTVRDAAAAKRDEIINFLAAASGAFAVSDNELQDTTSQLIDLNARIMTLDYALGNEVNWGAMMSHIASVKPGTFTHASAN